MRKQRARQPLLELKVASKSNDRPMTISLRVGASLVGLIGVLVGHSGFDWLEKLKQFLLSLR